MSLEPDPARAQSYSHPQCQAHPIPLYESDNYIYYQAVSCEIEFAHAHVRAHLHVCDVRAKSILKRVCDVRACGPFGRAMCDLTLAHFL